MDDLQLGHRIQTLRAERDLSVRKLSSLAGITPSMLSQIENERVTPSIQTLRGLAAALDVPLYSFFRQDNHPSPVVTPDQRTTIGRKEDPDVAYELLTPDTRGSIEFCMMIIPPNASSNAQPQCHTGEEVAFFHRGESLELEMDGTRYPMRPGDSVRICAHTRHLWHNTGCEPAQVLFALSPPSF